MITIEECIETLKKRYLNKDIDVIEEERYYDFEVDGEVTKLPYKVHFINPVDYDELADTLKLTGMDYRILLPSTIATADYRLDRINVYITKDKDRWYIQDIDLG